MSEVSVVNAIAAVMRDHVRIRYDERGTPWCECGAEWNINDGHAAHVAAVVAEALGLTEEWALCSGANITRSMSEESARFKAAKWPESFEAVRRPVGPWVAVVRGAESGEKP